jgi:hypothetical protein
MTYIGNMQVQVPFHYILFNQERWDLPCSMLMVLNHDPDFALNNVPLLIKFEARGF